MIETSEDESKQNRGRGYERTKKMTYADVVKGKGITNAENNKYALKKSK